MARAQTFSLPLDAGDGGQQQSIPSAKKQTPIGTISVGYAYLWADQGGYHRSLNGWLAKPTFNLANGWAVYADASNYYGANRKGSVNLHTYSLGVSKEIFPKPRLKPALFLQMGDSRTSNAGTITNGYALLTGVNFTTPLNKWVSLSIIPAEYVYAHPAGENRNSYNAKFSLVFPFGKKKS
ncbi:hypothetical protein [Terriglobus sp.]|uniref:hypothetical protein n=1 Tax=Terriglobus sp. TaxID=1889013 RepID=UPI003AFF6A26